MAKITFAVITKNEESQIGDCLACATWADDIVVVDSNSVDRTVEIARRFTENVHQREFVSFAQVRNEALELAQGDWILFVDADERVMPELAAEVQAITANCDLTLSGYWIPRKDIIWGKWIRHGGWYPDYQLRLLKRDKAHYDDGRKVHELVILDGEAGHLANPFIHYNYSSIRQFLRKQEVYSSLEAQILHDQGIRAKPHNFILQPLRAFKRRYWHLRGFRDGAHGLLLSTLLAYYEFVTYRKLLGLGKAQISPQRNRDTEGAE